MYRRHRQQSCPNEIGMAHLSQTFNRLHGSELVGLHAAPKPLTDIHGHV